MHHKFETPPELNDFEQRLRAGVSWGTSTDRDRLLYQAGRAAAGSRKATANRKTYWIWPASSGLLATTSALLAFMLFQVWDSSNNSSPIAAHDSSGSPRLVRNCVGGSKKTESFASERQEQPSDSGSQVYSFSRPRWIAISRNSQRQRGGTTSVLTWIDPFDFYFQPVVSTANPDDKVKSTDELIRELLGQPAIISTNIF